MSSLSGVRNGERDVEILRKRLREERERGREREREREKGT
jgi:hypothetical protein